MAKRFKRTKRRGGFSKLKRSFKSRSSGVNLLTMTAASAAYGYARPKIVNMAAPYVSKLPFGNYNNSIVLGGIGYLAAKKGKGMIRDAGFAVLAVEAANLTSSAMSSSSTNNSSSETVYG